MPGRPPWCDAYQVAVVGREKFRLFGALKIRELMRGATQSDAFGRTVQEVESDQPTHSALVLRLNDKVRDRSRHRIRNDACEPATIGSPTEPMRMSRVTR